ncbi:MAG: DUF805 domain-containing protein [Akkermansia sp.]
MPYFITHYADFKSRCPNKPYWRFIIAYQLVFTLLLIPFMWHYTMTLIADSQFLDSLSLVEGIDTDALLQMSYRVLHEASASMVQDGGITMACTVMAAGVALLLLLPTIAMTVCRLRDSGSSQLWWLSLLPSYLLYSLLYLYPDSSLWDGRFSLFSSLCSIPSLLFLAVLVKASSKFPCPRHRP